LEFSSLLFTLPLVCMQTKQFMSKLYANIRQKAAQQQWNGKLYVKRENWHVFKFESKFQLKGIMAG
jgi:hypothetical protein